MQLVSRIEELAQKHGCTSAQLALAWLLGRGEDIVPIPGTKKRARLEENAGALEIELSPQELAEIEEIAPQNVAAGERYSESSMATLEK